MEGDATLFTEDAGMKVSRCARASGRAAPLAPITFAAVMDLFLRFLTHHFGDSIFHRAFADDVGIVLSNFREQLPELIRVLRAFAAISGMEINIAKCVCVPLDGRTPEETKADIRTIAPEWEEAPVQLSAKYVAFYMGPGKMSSSGRW